MFSLTFIAFLAGSLSPSLGFFNLFKYPMHASCEVNWEFRESCQSVRQRLVSQMEAWQGDSLCPGTSPQCPSLPCGQRCLYQYTGGDQDSITGTHTTPVARYTDDLSFKLLDTTGGCTVKAKSSSQLWYAVLDKGTNYCNLRNLVEGAGLSNSLGFSEETRDKVCTQYSSRDCSRY